MKKIAIFVIIILSFGVPNAFAHPFLGETFPPAASTTLPGVEQVIIHYSEAVDVNFSIVKVLDGSGNQIDNKDTRYYEGETSLTVTTPPLEEGVYTVTTKVLSKIDGHLVDYAFVFGIGDVTLDTAILDQQESSESVFIPESIARFPGLVGQTIVLGLILSSLFIWNYIKRKRTIKENSTELELKFQSKFSSLLAIGLLAVLGSNLAILGVQTWRLDASPIDAIQTSFGLTWAFRMGITVALLGLWFALQKTNRITVKKLIPLLGLSLILIGTTTMMGHGAASEQIPAIILDYIHNLLSSVWIGGIFFFAFVLLPTYSILLPSNKEKITLATIPKFSKIITLSIGILLITGPTLLWFLDSNISSLTTSSYGYILIAKIAIAAAMVSIGAYNQFVIQKKAEKNAKTDSHNTHGKIKKSLKIEIVLGLALLASVALLTNTSLPAGEIQQAEAHDGASIFRVVDFSENAKFDVTIDPLSSGTNSISVIVSDFSDMPLDDISGFKIKVSNPARNIAPIEIPITKANPDEHIYEGDITFGFSGIWKLELEVQRTQNANENLSFDILIKPHLENLQIDLTEYDFPEEATPLFPLYDGKGNLWISDPLEPRIWKFNIDTEEFTKYEFDGMSSIVLELDSKGRIWFTDIPEHRIGYFNPVKKEFKLYDLPLIVPVPEDSIPISLSADNDDNIWISITNKNKLLKFETEIEEFTEYVLPTEDSGPFSLELGPSGRIWFTQSIAGQIGYIVPDTGEIAEFKRSDPLQGPEDLIFDEKGNLWIAEHTGTAITKFNPILETFESTIVPDSESLPFGMVFDKYKNLWFAQHVIDKIGVFDIQNKEIIEVDVPTEQSFIQFTTKDDNDNIWFVEQQGNKLAKISLTEIPNLGITKKESTTQEFSLRYADLVAPLLSIGIILTSLFFIKSVNDNRRLDRQFP